MDTNESASSASANTSAAGKVKPVASRKVASNPKATASAPARKASAPALKPKQVRNKVDPMVKSQELLKEKGQLTRRMAIVDRRLLTYGAKLQSMIAGMGLPSGAVKRAAKKAKRQGTSKVDGGFRLNGDGSATAAVMVAEVLDITGGVARETITKQLDGKMKGIAISQSLAKLYKWGDAEKQATANGERIALTAQGQAKLNATHQKMEAASAPANAPIANGSAQPSA